MMRWPFVSRARFENEREARRMEMIDRVKAEEAVARQRWEVDFWEDRWNELKTVIVEYHEPRYAELLDKYHALRVQGAVVPEPKPQISPAKPQGPIAEAIDEVCARYANSVKLRRRLMKYAEDMKRSDGEDAEIAHAILHWRSPDDDEAVT